MKKLETMITIEEKEEGERKEKNAQVRQPERETNKDCTVMQLRL